MVWAALLLTSCPLVLAQEVEVKLRVDEDTVEPVAPTINLRASDPVVVVRILGDLPTPIGTFSSYPDLPAYDRTSASGEIQLAAVGSPGRTAGLSFRRCDAETLKIENIRTIRPGDGLPSREVSVQDCPFAVLNKASSWLVFGHKRTLLFTVDAYQEPTGDLHTLLYSRAFPIFIREQPWDLRWSAGFTFFNRRDERYRLVDAAAENEEPSFEQVSAGSYPYQLSAFAHYHPLAGDWFAVSAGVGADVPVEDLSVMLGASVSLRTLPLVNSLYATAGLSYSPADRLKARFEGITNLQEGTSQEDLVERESGFGIFIALTFGFAGGEEQFRGVVSGSRGSEP